MQSVDADSTRAIVLLLAAVITLVGVVLNIAHARAKEAATPRAKSEIYRDILGWVETALWAAGLLAGILFGLQLALGFWLVAYILGCWFFLTAQDTTRLRIDIFKLVFSSQALVALWALSSDSQLLNLIRELVGALKP